MNIKKKSSVKKNYLYNLAYQIIGILTPIIITPYISRVLDADGIGLYQYVFSISSYFTIIVILGTSMYGQREVATYQNDPILVGKIFVHIQLLRFVMLILSTIGYGIVIIALWKTKYTILLFIEYIVILASFFDISWLFQGLEQFKLVSIRSCIIKLGTVVLLFVFVNSKSDLNLYAAITSFGVLVGNLFLWVYIRKFLIITKIEIEYFIIVAKDSWVFFIPTIATTIYAYLDKVLLGMFSTDFETGYYSQGEKIIKILITIVTSLSIVLLPRITSLLKDNELEEARNIIKRSWKYVLMLSIPMTVGISCISKQFVPFFFGKGYKPVALLMVILSPLAIIIGSNSVFGYTILVPTKHQKEYNKAAVLGAIANLIIDLLLIPQYGSIGACIGTLAAELSVCCTEYYYSKKIIGKILPKRNIFNYFLSAAFMAGVLLLLNKTGIFVSFLIFAEVAIGVTSYFVFLFILRDELALDTLEMVRKKVRAIL